MTCETCKANKVCDHNKYGFENCGNYISVDSEKVMCGECKYWVKTVYDPLFEKSFGNCHNNDFPFMCETRPVTCVDDFCSYGERKTVTDKYVGSK